METVKMQQYSFTPRNSEDLSLIETFFKALKLDLNKVESDDFVLSKKQTEKIIKGIDDAQNDRVLTSAQVREKTAKWRR